MFTARDHFCLFSPTRQGPSVLNPRLDAFISDLFSTKTIRFHVITSDDGRCYTKLVNMRPDSGLIVSCPSTANVATIKTIVATNLACRGIMHMYKGPYGRPADDNDAACSFFREVNDQYADLSGVLLVTPHVEEMCAIHYTFSSPDKTYRYLSSYVIFICLPGPFTLQIIQAESPAFTG
jgi:hypothetical protein